MLWQLLLEKEFIFFLQSKLSTSSESPEPPEPPRSHTCFNPLMANDAFRRHKWFHLKKDNSLRKRSKCMKITRYVEQTLGKISTIFQRTPCAKTYTQGCTRGVPLLAAGSKGAVPLTLIGVLVWLLRGHRLQQFVGLGGSLCPRTAAPQLCTLCGHAVLVYLVNPIKLGGSARLRARHPEWAWFRETKGGSPGGADHGLDSCRLGGSR